MNNMDISITIDLDEIWREFEDKVQECASETVNDEFDNRDLQVDDNDIEAVVRNLLNVYADAADPENRARSCPTAKAFERAVRRAMIRGLLTDDS